MSLKCTGDINTCNCPGCESEWRRQNEESSLGKLYSQQCPDCGGHIHKLSISETENEELLKAFNKAARWIFRSKKTDINPDDIEHKNVQPLLNGIDSILQDGFSRGIEHVVPYIMRRDLAENIYIFSGAKTFAELKEMSDLLLDADGNIKSFSKFWQDVQNIHPQYNESYLQAEYIFATQSAQMASKWQEVEADGDRYNLQYRTAYDDRVRESHALLHNTTLPPSDPFWAEYYPPNGWRCRCTAVQVRKTKYEESNSADSILLGSKATEGKNSIFRFNPGKQKVIFPPNHPYMKKLNGIERETLVKRARERNEIKTASDVVNTINEVSKGKNWLERGFKKLDITKKSGVNGSTDMYGNISLTRERFNNTISGINKLSKKEDITFNEADSLSTFWHEITHNRNKKGSMYLTRLQRRYMELANEYVSRQTLPEFYEAFSSKVPYPELMENRKSTGYNRMVNNFQKIVEKTGLKKEKVSELVQKHLFNEPYTDQKTGLVNALAGAKKADGSALKKAELNSLIRECDERTETAFEKYIEHVIH